MPHLLHCNMPFTILFLQLGHSGFFKYDSNKYPENPNANPANIFQILSSLFFLFTINETFPNCLMYLIQCNLLYKAFLIQANTIINKEFYLKLIYARIFYQRLPLVNPFYLYAALCAGVFPSRPSCVLI